MNRAETDGGVAVREEVGRSAPVRDGDMRQGGSLAMETDTCIVWGHVGDGSWQMDAYGRQASLALAMSRILPVVLLSRRGGHYLRPPEAIEVRRHGERLLELHGAFDISSRRGFRKLGAIPRMLDRGTILRAIRRLGFKRHVAWLCVNDPVLLKAIRGDKLVYDCIDPCFNDRDLEWFERQEAGLAARADVVFATAGTLEAPLRSVNPRTYRLPNATTDEPFSRVQEPEGLRKLIAGLPRPVIGYLGTIDWRFDAAFVLEIARRMPGASLLLGGRINSDQEEKIRPLRACPNVRLTGSVPLEWGAAFLQAVDVGLIPFVPGRVGDAINPVKMYTYLAAGKPVVTTQIAECRGRPGVFACDAGADAAGVIGRLWERHADPVAETERREFARANTWDVRAREAVEILRRHGVV